MEYLQRKVIISRVTAKDFNGAEIVIVKYERGRWIAQDFRDLKCRKRVKKGPPLRELCPFIDVKGLLIVGGQLSKSNASYDYKHIILPSNSSAATLLYN